MTETKPDTPEFNADARISPATAITLRAMIPRPKGKFFCDGLAAALDRPRATIRTILYNLQAAGWLTSEYEERGRYQARRYYRFTPRGLKAARAEIETWDFTDE